MRTPALALVVSLVTACSAPDGAPLAFDSGTIDGAMDAGQDASQDAGADAAAPLDSSVLDGSAMDAAASDASTQDAGLDAGPDASVDAGPCTCTSGPCCDGCHLIPAYTQCSPSVVTTSCSSSGGQTIAWTTTNYNVCDGVTTKCATGAGTSVPTYCDQPAGQVCRVIGGVAQCL